MDPYAGLLRTLWVCVCVCVCVCVSKLCVKALPCKFFSQIIRLGRVKLYSEEKSKRRPVWMKQKEKV